MFSRSQSLQIPSRTREVKHPILFDPGEILPKDYSIMPVKWPFIQAVPELHRLWCSQTHGGSPVTGAAPLQGAHTWLLPARDAVLVSIMGTRRAGWVNFYTWKLLISGDWDKKTIYSKENSFFKGIVINKACGNDRIRSSEKRKEREIIISTHIHWTA